eukprot:gene1962-2407_t
METPYYRLKLQILKSGFTSCYISKSPSLLYSFHSPPPFSLSLNQHSNNSSSSDEDEMEITHLFYHYSTGSNNVWNQIPNSSITHLKIINDLGKSSSSDDTILKMLFPGGFDENSGGKLYSVTHFYTPPKFNGALSVDDFSMMVSLTHLSFKHSEFNQPILPDTLPKTLLFLNLGSCFNQILLEGSIPNSVRTLIIGSNFDQHLLIGSIPMSVTTLIMESRYTKKIRVPGVLPASITHLEASFTQPPLTDGVLPPNLKYFRYVHLDLNQLTEFPKQVTHLVVEHPFIMIIKGMIKHTVSILEFGIYYNNFIPVGAIPNSVKQLRFGTYFRQVLMPGTIPPSVQYLEFGAGFNQKIESNVIPISVTTLVFRTIINQKLNSLLPTPSNISHLHIECFNPSTFSKSYSFGYIPSSVHTLVFESNFTRDIPIKEIPRSVRLFHIIFQENGRIGTYVANLKTANRLFTFISTLLTMIVNGELSINRIAIGYYTSIQRIDHNQFSIISREYHGSFYRHTPKSFPTLEKILTTLNGNNKVYGVDITSF